MVRGINIFKKYFEEYHDNYVIIGGTACDLIIDEAGFTPRATKDIIFHFSSGCGLFVIQAYPLEFESKNEEPNDWQKQLELGKFSSQEKTAFKQLRNYYKSFGFNEIQGYKDLLFYDPLFKNERLNAINLEE
jgi:hypothetical protein